MAVFVKTPLDLTGNPMGEKPIKDLRVTPRIKDALSAMGIHKLSELVDAQNIRTMPGIGMKHARQLEEELSRLLGCEIMVE